MIYNTPSFFSDQLPFFFSSSPRAVCLSFPFFFFRLLFLSGCRDNLFAFTVGLGLWVTVAKFQCQYTSLGFY